MPPSSTERSASTQTSSRPFGRRRPALLIGRIIGKKVAPGPSIRGNELNATEGRVTRHTRAPAPAWKQAKRKDLLLLVNREGATVYVVIESSA